MRLFVAVEIDDRARHAAAASLHALRLAVEPAVEARWVPPDNMHLTARFIGHVADRVVPDLLAALTRPVNLAPFDVQLGTCGVFPAAGPARVIWIGLAGGHRELSLLHDEFDRRLAPFGFAAERRAFSAHLTLARIKRAAASASIPVRAAVADVTPERVVFRVQHATIFESRASPAGVRYDPRGRAPLTVEG